VNNVCAGSFKKCLLVQENNHRYHVYTQLVRRDAIMPKMKSKSGAKLSALKFAEADLLSVDRLLSAIS
jgi:hypothetical protein